MDAYGRVRALRNFPKARLELDTAALTASDLPLLSRTEKGIMFDVQQSTSSHELPAHPLPSLSAIADPARPVETAEALLAYLEPRLEVGRLRLAEQLLEIPHSWEAYIYRFRLQGDHPLPQAFDSPLTLRVYGGSGAAARARHEFSMMCHVRLLGYPSPWPLILEQDCRIFGGPFLILEWIPGITLLDRLRRRFTRFLRVPTQLAQMHLNLHALPVTGIPAPPGEFLDRRLDKMWDVIDKYGLDGLIPGMDWLEEHRPKTSNPPSILHLDFHPDNLIARDDSDLAVLDWSQADIGDRHADVATTLLLMDSAPVPLTTTCERMLSRPTRWILKRRYLRIYRRHFPLDPDVLNYFLAWAAVRRLAMYGMWQRAGSQVNGYKRTSLLYLTSGHINALRRLFQQVGGITLTPDFDLLSLGSR
jgi:aminoglycoside phosphotransferase (APT) family kinase protein